MHTGDELDEGRMHEDLEDLLVGLYPWARRLAIMLSGPSRGEDLVQDAFVRVMQRPPDALAVPVVRAWLRTTMVRLHLRQNRRLVREIALLASFHSPDAEVQQPASWLVIDVLTALEGLPRRQRACLVLYYLEDLPESEVARLLGIRHGTVKAHLAQGRANLRRAFLAHGEHEPLVEP